MTATRTPPPTPAPAITRQVAFRMAIQALRDRAHELAFDANRADLMRASDAAALVSSLRRAQLRAAIALLENELANLRTARSPFPSGKGGKGG